MFGVHRCVHRLAHRRSGRALLCAGAAFAVLLPPAALGPGLAWAHGAAQWIADGGYKAPSGATCCGVSDCHRVAGAKATRVLNGYKVAVEINGNAYDLFAPTAAVFGSIDDAVWFCALPQDYLNGQARCLFLPGSV
jgi:hypothetical protein